MPVRTGCWPSSTGWPCPRGAGPIPIRPDWWPIGVGALAARSHLVELGIPQQALINDAVLAIAAGESEVAAVVGGEAKRWARDLDRAGREGVETAQPGVVPDVVHRRAGPLMEPVEVAHRLWDPVQQYAMIDNALRAAEGRTLAEHRSEIARAVGRLQPGGTRQPRSGLPRARWTPHWSDTPSPSNRPLAFPYNKWHSTQWTVNQAAALLLCSVGGGRLRRSTRRPLGVPPGWRRVQPRRLAPAPDGAARVAGHGCARARRGRSHRPADRRGRGPGGLQLLSRRRPGPAARAGAAARSGTPTVTGGHGLRRRPVQQLRPAGDGRGGGPGCGPIPEPSGWSPRSAVC